MKTIFFKISLSIILGKDIWNEIKTAILGKRDGDRLLDKKEREDRILKENIA